GDAQAPQDASSVVDLAATEVDLGAASDLAGSANDQAPTLAPPDTVITAAPQDTEWYSYVTFGFEASPAEPGVHFECALDGGAWKSCTSPRMMSVSSGQHTFAVRAIDATGKVDPTPATRTWTSDDSFPALEITKVPPDPSSDPRPAIEFTCDDSSATVTC